MHAQEAGECDRAPTTSCGSASSRRTRRSSRAAISSSAREPTSRAPRPRSTSASTPTSRTSSARPVLVVVKGGSAERDGRRRSSAARDSLKHKGCTIFGVLVNRVPAEHVDEVTRKARAAGRRRARLRRAGARASSPTPTVGGGRRGRSDATIVRGAGDALQREVRDIRVAAMSVEHFVDDLVEGALVIVPGDRPDILVASLASTVSPAIPTVAGVVLTGGYPLSRHAAPAARERTVPGARGRRSSTHEAAAAVQAVRPLLRAETSARSRRALGAVRGRRRHGRARTADRARAARARDADHVRVRADRARAVEQAPHRPAGGRRRPDPARSGDPPAPRRRRPDASSATPTRSAPRAAALGVDLEGVASRRPARRSPPATGSQRATTSCAGTRA